MTTEAQVEATPIITVAEADHGAETARNYRYQAAYSVILLIGAAAGRLDLKSVWCEQHDDILAQINERLFDAYQVKTQRPERGAWELTDEPFVKSLKTFLKLDAEYNGQFRRFHFVSNTECLETEDKKKKHLCPKTLVQTATSCFRPEDLDDSTRKGFQLVLDATAGAANNLFKILQKLVFVKGPSRESFESEIAQNHIGQLEWCQLTQDKLERLVNRACPKNVFFQKPDYDQYSFLASMY
ncbi:MAG TPA: dsDNA nuclease domain-containing protein [Clostridia bacterium]|nr:dsDNA nuclease domain-containing protein [Clostridia bacterium]